METNGLFILHEGSPHLLLDGFPKDLLQPKDGLLSTEVENAPGFVAPARQGSWPLETSEGPGFREGYLFPLQGQLGDNGRKAALCLCESLKQETLARGLHKIRLDAGGAVIGWGRGPAVA